MDYEDEDLHELMLEHLDGWQETEYAGCRGCHGCDECLRISWRDFV